MKIENEFIPYEQALALKELGFDEPCFAFWDAYNGDTHLFLNLRLQYHWMVRVYKSIFNKKPIFILDISQNYLEYLEGDNAVLAPSYQQAFRWFREKYDLQYNIIWNKFYEKTPYQYEVRQTWRNETLRPYGTSGMCKTYEEAELACLKKLIEIVKQ
jgi:hypothetical protein